MDGGDRQLTSWLKEEGFNTNLRCVREVMQPFAGTTCLKPLSCPGIACKQGTFSRERDVVRMELS